MKEEFVPFSVSINHWNKKSWNQCCFNRPTEEATLFAYNEDFRKIIKEVKVGHTLSIFFFVPKNFFHMHTQLAYTACIFFYRFSLFFLYRKTTYIRMSFMNSTYVVTLFIYFWLCVSMNVLYLYINVYLDILTLLHLY